MKITSLFFLQKSSTTNIHPKEGKAFLQITELFYKMHTWFWSPKPESEHFFL